MLMAMRNEAELRMNQYDGTYWYVLASLAKEYARQRLFAQSRTIIQQLDSGVHTNSHHRLDATHALARASKDPRDIAAYKEMGERRYDSDRLSYAICLSHIAAITGDEKDFAACQEVLEEKTQLSRQKCFAYHALAIAYAECGQIQAARDTADKIVVPYIESKTLARIARIILSQDPA